MKKRLFGTLQVYYDEAVRSAAMNMAIDEALLESVIVPTIRFYHWQSPALSLGYFGRFADVARYEHERNLVRRWTGGGIVFHGADLTYSIVIPASDRAFAESSMSIYEKIHYALCEALKKRGQPALVAAGADRGGITGANDHSYNCFENPVRSDVIVGSRKVAGAAQRRTRRGLLQQGSIQGIEVDNDLAQRFAETLSVDRSEREFHDEVLRRARDLVERKYGTDVWLRKR
jgi:lipoate-protein ligase A